jgi:CRP/FNR family cyclic AMP-dependent transcriptional regulator
MAAVMPTNGVSFSPVQPLRRGIAPSAVPPRAAPKPSRSGHLDVLAAIPQAHRDAVRAHCCQRRYRKGEVLWHQGDAAPTVAFLVEGKAVSEYHSPSGRTVITGLWFPGDLMGANNLAPYNVHEMTVRFIENSVVYALPVERLYAFVRSDPDWAEAIIKALSVRVHWFGHLALLLFTQTAWERACGILLALSEHFGVETKDGLLIDLNLTHETLAAMVGVTRSFLTTTLKQLERSGLVHRDRRRIVIHDPTRLEACAYAGDPAMGTRQSARLPKRVAST